MKYLLLVHHKEDLFNQILKGRLQAMLEESIQLCHQLDSNRQYIHISMPRLCNLRQPESSFECGTARRR
jgi:hypothetical protein